MSFALTYGTDDIKPIVNKKLILPSTSNTLLYDTLNNAGTFLLQSGDSLFLYDSTFTATQLLPDFSAVSPALSKNCIVGVKDSTISLFWKDNSSANTFTYTYAQSTFSSLPVVSQNTSSVDILIGTKSGKLLKLAGSSSGLSFASVLDSTGLTVPVTKVSRVGDTYRFVKQDSSAFTLYSSSESSISAAGIVRDMVVTKTNAGSDQIIILTKGNQFFVFAKGAVVSTFTLSQFSEITSFAIFDLKQDGTNYICFQINDRIYAYNYLGNPADNFPLLVSAVGSHECKPSAVKIAGSSATTLFSLTSTGLYANEGISGKKVSGFPLSIAAGNASSPVLFNLNDKLCIGNVDNNGNIFTWQIASSSGQILYTGLQGTNANTGYIGLINKTNMDNRFFPTEKVYNYPNPVNSGKTFIRYYTSENAKINIKIFDIAGDLAAELNGYATAGLDNETSWDVSSIQSGAYLARVEATSDSGKKEFVIIKIAVVK